MSTVDSVLARIDDTLAGYEGVVSRESGDAMRWVPDRMICDGGQPMRIGRRPPVAPWTLNTMDSEAVSRALAAFAASITVSMQEAGQAVAAFARALGKTLPSFAKLAHLAGHTCRGARCRDCNPAGNPLPLAIDGREYHRRQLARRRRKR